MANTDTATREAPRRSKRAKERAKEAARLAKKTVTTTANDAAKAATETLDANPMGMLAGAIAAGAVAAALIPTTRQELQALGPWAEKMRDALEDAFESAKDAGLAELTAGGLTFAAASDGVGGIIGKIVKAAGAASGAAATTVKSSRRSNGSTSDAQPSPSTIDA